MHDVHWFVDGVGMGHVCEAVCLLAGCTGSPPWSKVDPVTRCTL